ncbi:hypothetical protein B0H10DRAFT_2084361 [Mycena sp. CBHHK59/15]|nr:hypothetical protein B0H10DRAFT_2084361 [Mycena sp. CBHHK59/15]
MGTFLLMCLFLLRSPGPPRLLVCTDLRSRCVPERRNASQRCTSTRQWAICCPFGSPSLRFGSDRLDGCAKLSDSRCVSRSKHAPAGTFRLGEEGARRRCTTTTRAPCGWRSRRPGGCSEEQSSLCEDGGNQRERGGVINTFGAD